MGKSKNRDRIYDAEDQFQENHKRCETGEPGKIGLSRHSLVSLCPKTSRHKKFVEDYYKTPATAFVVTGYAGTAKTFLAMWLAFDSVFDQEGYHKVVVIRSPVETRDTGFKPGTEEEKAAVFEKPYKSLTMDLFKEAGPSTYNYLKKQGVFQFELSSNQRGVTFHNSIVIIDEVQNMDYDELKTILTRAGQNCKFIICGDFAQDDLKRDRRNAESGLRKWMEVFKRMDDNVTSVHSFYHKDDIVRSDFVRDLLITEIEMEKEIIKLQEKNAA